MCIDLDSNSNWNGARGVTFFNLETSIQVTTRKKNKHIFHFPPPPPHTHSDTHTHLLKATVWSLQYAASKSSETHLNSLVSIVHQNIKSSILLFLNSLKQFLYIIIIAMVALNWDTLTSKAFNLQVGWVFHEEYKNGGFKALGGSYTGFLIFTNLHTVCIIDFVNYKNVLDDEFLVI